jgi:DNA-binding LacI/PurR family transcriptional regulator
MPPSRSTIADVARRADVSIATVSRVLNRPELVDGGTAVRVRSAIAALNYTPHAAARTLASRRTDTLGLLLPDIGSEFFQPLLQGIEAGVSEAGFDLLIHATRSPRSPNVPHRPLGEHNTDGLLVFTQSLDTQELTRLHQIGFPVVLLHQTPPDSLEIPVITIQNQSGAQKIVEHLIDVHGHQRIAFLQGPTGHEDSDWRERGYRRALRDHSLPYDPALVTVGGFDSHVAQTAVEGLIRQGIDFDAIFCGDDDSAVGAIQALRQARRKIPGDVAVVGFDDSIFAQILTPPLTTVRSPMEQVGREAVHQLIRIIRGEQVEPRLTLPTELVIRRSCGCQT